jgi:hypothetical protein
MLEQFLDCFRQVFSTPMEAQLEDWLAVLATSVALFLLPALAIANMFVVGPAPHARAGAGSTSRSFWLLIGSQLVVGAVVALIFALDGQVTLALIGACSAGAALVLVMLML